VLTLLPASAQAADGPRGVEARPPLFLAAEVAESKSIQNPSPQGQSLQGRRLKQPRAGMNNTREWMGKCKKGQKVQGKLWTDKGKKKIQQESTRDQETGGRPQLKPIPKYPARIFNRVIR